MLPVGVVNIECITVLAKLFFFIWQLAYLSPSCATTLTSNKHVQIPIIMKASSSLRLLCAVGAGAVNNERITVLTLF